MSGFGALLLVIPVDSVGSADGRGEGNEGGHETASGARQGFGRCVFRFGK